MPVAQVCCCGGDVANCLMIDAEDRWQLMRLMMLWR
jgi:hypothetical protein